MDNDEILSIGNRPGSEKMKPASFFLFLAITQSVVRDLRNKMQFPKLHFGPGLFDLERSKVKGQDFLTLHFFPQVS